MKTSQHIGVGTGLFVVSMLTLSLLAIFYLGWQAAGLPFAPFDVFDWLTRVLPGKVIAFGIENMVRVIRALHLGPTSATAKLAEQAMAILGLFVTGLILGTIVFLIIRKRSGRHAIALGLGLGIIVGVPVLLISQQVSANSPIAPGLRVVWILGLFLAWGAALGGSSRRLLAPAQAAGPAETTELTAEQISVLRIDRRNFLIRLGGATATITVAGAVVGELAETRRRMNSMTMAQPWSASHSLPNKEATVRPAPGTRPELTSLDRHYRIDINTTPPSVDEQQWRLKISGLVEKALALSLDEVKRYEPMHQFITLSCISNPVGGDLIGTTRWTGVSMQTLLKDWRLKPGANHLKITGADSFYEIVALEAIQADPRVMLTYAWDGLPLTRDHGFPLRIYIPDVHGMKQPKWIVSIEATDHWEPGYWVARGWDKIARMKATSVIDSVAVDMTIINAAQGKLVPIGGIAHAGARGISKVEVQVDEGPWQPAMLRAPLSPLTWVVWRYDWPFQPGKHTFTVRCYDGAGAAQIVTHSPPAPSGASGLYSKTQML